jgi:uncharacterized membrane protein
MALAWQLVNHSAVTSFGAVRQAQGYLAARNAAFLIDHPLRFAGVIFWTNIAFFQTWVSQFVGMLGWLTIRLNPVLVVMYCASVIMAARVRTTDLTVSPSQKAILLLFGLLTLLYLDVTLWIVCADSKQFQQAINGIAVIHGIQGRYFLPIALPILILISSRPFLLRKRILWMTATVISIVQTGALVTVWRAYV